MSLKEIAEVLKSSESILICGHTFPDGDCIGSTAALGLALKEIGKKVVMASSGSIPETLLFLPGVNDFCVNCMPEEKFDTMVVLDCSDSERLGLYKHFLNQVANLVCIDHHVSARGFDGYNYIDPQSSATGEIIIDLLDLMGITIIQDMAVCLYTAIVTDTGSFRYEKTTSDTLRKAAKLIDTGIDIAFINTNLFEENPLPSIQILGAALNSLKLSHCGRIAWMVIDKMMLEIYSANNEHTEGIVNVARSIKGVKVSILFKEVEQDRYKISFRSKGQINVDSLASRFGGGGHAKASGCMLSGNIEEVVEAVLREARIEVSKAGK